MQNFSNGNPLKKTILFIIKCGNAGKLLTLKEFKRSAAACGNMGHLIAVAECINGCRRVAAAYNGYGVGLGKALCNCNSACCQGRVFKYAHRSVPNNGLSVLNFVCEKLRSLRSYIKTLVISGNLVGVNRFNLDRCVYRIREMIGYIAVNRQKNLNALLFSLFEHIAAVVDLLGIEQRLTNAVALSG